MTTPSQRMQQGFAGIFGGLKTGIRSIRLPFPDPLKILRKITQGGPVEIEDPIGDKLMEELDKITGLRIR